MTIFFQETRWTTIKKASHENSSISRSAFEELYKIYWRPLYFFIKSKGLKKEETEDILQGFFLHLIEKNGLRKTDRDKGTFRSFLLSSLKNFMANEWHHENALKSGGSCSFVSLDTDDDAMPMNSGNTLIDEGMLESMFDRQWALTIINRVFERLRSEHEAKDEFIIYKELISSVLDTSGEKYSEKAEKLGISTENFKVRIYRMRKKLQLYLREEIANTVSTEGEIDGELSYLMSVFIKEN